MNSLTTTKIDENIQVIEENIIHEIKDDSLQETIFDFTTNIETQILALERYFELFNDLTIEIISRLTGMYQFGGTKSLERLLIRVCKKCNVSPFLKLEAAKSLLSFTEEEETIDEKDTPKMKEIKTESNLKIREKNKQRKTEAYKCLDCVCYCLGDLASPCKVEAVCYLMECEDYKKQSLTYFCEVINDPLIDCDFRYKAILSLEIVKDSKGPEKYNIQDRNYFLKNSCLEFLSNDRNYTMYRILAGQYLLQRISLDSIVSRKVQLVLLGFARDEHLDINLRADAADTLLNLAEEFIRDEARGIIMTLGRLLGGARTVFNNAQNVHVTEVEDSVKEILGFLTSFPTMEINKKSVDFDYVNAQIQEIIKNQKDMKVEELLKLRDLPSITDNSCQSGATGTSGATETSEATGTSGTSEATGPSYINCTFCNTIYKEDDIENIQEKKIENKFFCCNECFKEYDRLEKMIISLNRINIDRILYSKYNQTLANILIKVWSFVVQHDCKDEMIKRLLEELGDMSGTCSSGFASRLCNILSGYTDYSIKISFTDQIIANFIARLNARTRKICEPDSIYFGEKYRDIVFLYMKENNLIKKAKNIKDIKTRDFLIDEYLKENTGEKIKLAVESFSDNVLVEMVNSDNYENRPHFIQFFCDTMPIVRAEMYPEFKEYVSDYEFDLATRSAVSTYEGLSFLI
jgi:hypothetical protein